MDKVIETKSDKREITLTEQNWKFLKALRQGAKVYEAYQIAGYEGKSPNAPYILYNEIKKKLQEVVESDGFDKLRLAMDFEKVLSLPLAESTNHVSLNEWLKIRNLAHKIMTSDSQKASQSAFTMIVIESGQPASVIVKDSKVIDAEVIKPD